MKSATVGRARKYSDKLVQRVRMWKPAKTVAAELGISLDAFHYLRKVVHKKACP